MAEKKKKDIRIDPLLMVVLSKRLDAISREMANTLTRTGRSGNINTAKDFSCGITDAQARMVCVDEGLPIHIVGAGLAAKSVTDLFDDIQPGDCFLNNSPYYGNSHHADFTFMVPVFYKGKHVFTTITRAHQGDIGNHDPTTYMPFASDVYTEGGLDFPCVRIQRDYKDLADIVRMAKVRIRAPEQWYGDYLAAIGSVRTGEKRIVEMCDKYGLDTVMAFTERWQEYGRTRMIEAIRLLPAGTWENETRHDPLPFVAPDGVPIRVKLTINPMEGYITLDFTDNIDCIPFGLNMSEATVMASAVSGVLNNLDPTLPHNWGAFSRIIIKVREGSVVGQARHPLSASMATTNLADRVINVVQACFGKVSKELGLAEGAYMPAAAGSVFGIDWRKNNALYVRQLMMGGAGGPGHHGYDGWLGYGIPVTAGVVHMDSIEIDEQAMPLLVDKHEVIPDSGGAGQWRGAIGMECHQRPRHDAGSWGFIADGHFNPPQGINGGLPGSALQLYKYTLDKGEETKTELPTVSLETLQPGEAMISMSSGGGGFGNPLDRDPEKVRHDVREGYVTLEKARDIYGVVINTDTELYSVNNEATKALRAGMKKNAEATK
ncbi:MAG: hydantoinase B/oxoprolinase family protein [Dehalococcoidia bacterium]|nr:hydantoinase B/oxoprolinase family protein [Dehalococcoidia bacterium]